MKSALQNPILFTLLASTATLAVADTTIELCGWTDYTGQCQIMTPELGLGSPLCTPYMIPNARNDPNDKSSILAKSLIVSTHICFLSIPPSNSPYPFYTLLLRKSSYPPR